MTTIQDLEERLDSFEQTLLQMAKNNVPITQKVDQTSNRVDEITPYTETKIAYFGEKEKKNEGKRDCWGGDKRSTL